MSADSNGGTEHEEQSRDRNPFRNERKQAGDERFDIWLPVEVAAWVRELAAAEDRTAPYQIRSLIRHLYTENVYSRTTGQVVEAGVNNLHRKHDVPTDAWDRLAP